MQNQHPEFGLPYGLARTVTCALVSAAARPCIDAIPIPATTNEMGHFQAAFQNLAETYGAAVVAAGKDYLALFRAVTLRSDENRAMRWLAMLRWVRDALVALAAEHIENLRPRELAAATR